MVVVFEFLNDISVLSIPIGWQCTNDLDIKSGTIYRGMGIIEVKVDLTNC